VLTRGLAAPDRIDRFSLRLTASSTTYTPIRSGRCLYICLCRAFPLTSFPARLKPCPKRGPFSGPTTARASGTAATSSYFALLWFALRLPRSTNSDVCDRLLLPTASTTSTPRFVRYRLLFETCVSPMTSGLHPRPRDRWDWHFTMPDPLRRGSFGLRAASFVSSARPDRAVPLTPLSLPDRLEVSQPRALSSLPRPLSPPFREDRTEVTTEGVFHR
jgi:hypothetical protein